MANVKVLNKDPFTYAEERRRFLEDLQRFHTTRATPFDRIPQIGGREIDLYRLYRTVTDLGGWQKVNNDLLWEDFQEDFNVPAACTNGAQALKYIYYRYLNIYEKVHFLGLDPDTCTDEQEEGPVRKKICLPVESIPLTYNYNHHKILESQREAANLSFDLVRFSDYDKLEMSLHSGLPNEVDFAVNVCLLLSNEGRYVLRLTKSIHLLTLLLANVGIFEDGSGTMEDVMMHSWRKSESKRDFLRFWHDVVKDEKIRENIRTKNGIYKRDEMAGSEVLHLGRNLGVQDAEGQRVLQLAMLIRNLSFEDVNQQFLASNPLVFRFLMLCVHSSYGSLRQLALDTLGNLAAQMVLRPVEAAATQLIMNLIKQSLMEDDKFAIVRALEMVSKLCQLEKNEVVLSEGLEGEMYVRMVQLLTVHDIQLIVHTLEALYQLSELGETSTDRIAHVKQAVDMLVNLITVEAQSYGPNSLMGIKVVEYVPPADLTAAHSSLPPPRAPSSRPWPPDTCPVSSGVQPTLHLSAADQARSDLETTASNWLQGTYETKKRSCTKLTDLFAEYQQFCCKFGIADALTATDLLSIVKPAIPQAKISEMDKGEGYKETVVKGLSKRAKPKPFAILAGSDKVCKPSPYSVPVNSLRGPGPANWLLNSDPMVAPASTHTPTLRQRLMEPPQTPPLPHPLVNYAGATGAGAPPTGRGGRGQQSGGKGGGKKRGAASASPAAPCGPGPGPRGTSGPLPHPPGPSSSSSLPMAPRPMLMPQQLHVAGAPQPAASVLQPGGGQQILIHAASSHLMKPSSMMPAPVPAAAVLPQGGIATFTSTPLMVSAPLTVLSSPSPSPGQQFPTIHQALQGDASGIAKMPASVADQGSETGFIKSLLAKKVCQNMVRQGNTTPSSSPPPPPPKSQADSSLGSVGQSSLLQSNPASQPGAEHPLARSHPPHPLKAQHPLDQAAGAGPVHHYQQQQASPHVLLASQGRESSAVHQQTVHTSAHHHQHQHLQQQQLQQLQQQQLQQQGAMSQQHQQSVGLAVIPQQGQIPAADQRVMASSFLQPTQSPLVYPGAVPAPHQPRMAPPPLAGQPPLAGLHFAHQHTQVAHLPQPLQGQPAAVPKEGQHQWPAPPPGAQLQQTGVSSLLPQQVSHTVPPQAGVVHSQPQYQQNSSVLAVGEPLPPAHNGPPQVVQTQPVHSQSPLVHAQPSQSQGNQTLPLHAALPQNGSHLAQNGSQVAQAQNWSQQMVQAQNGPQMVPTQPAQNPLQKQSVSQGVQTPVPQMMSQGQGVPPAVQHTVSQGVQVQSQAGMVSVHAQSPGLPPTQPLPQQMVQVPQGQQVMLHQPPTNTPQHIHIQHRMPGHQQQGVQLPGQQIMLQGSAAPVRAGQQPMVVQQQQQQQNQVVIQGQPSLQHVLHQPIHQIHIQSPQQTHIQGQGQPLRIQTQSPQPVVIQLPMYQLPQMTASHTATCASLPTPLVQTTPGGLAQAGAAPCRTIIPHQSASAVAALSSHRGVPQTSGDQADPARLVRDCMASGEGAGACEAQTVTVPSSGDSSHRSVCSAPSPHVDSEGRTVTPAIPAAHAVQTQCQGPSHPSLSSSSSSSAPLPHPAASSSSSSSSSSFTSLPCSQPGSTLSSSSSSSSSSMSITHALLSGQEVHRVGSNNPLHITPSAESHPHPARDTGHTNGGSSASGNSVPMKKDCNGLGEVNGGLASPDSASNDLPPSPMEGPKRPDHIPNGLLEGVVNKSWKEGGQLSKDLLHNVAEKMAKINGVVHHLENGDVKVSQTMDVVDQHSRVTQTGQTQTTGGDMEVDSTKKPEVWHVNGLSSLGPHSSSENHQLPQAPMFTPSRMGPTLVKQMSMEEVSLDSTDSRLVVTCSRAGEVRPLFSPNSSHDSDVSCDSFASSLADSVSSDKHSSTQGGFPMFPRPSTSSAPSPFPSCSSVFPEVPLVLAGTIPKSEALNKKNKKKAAPKPKVQKEKAPSKSKKRKGGKNAAPESPTPSVPAQPLVMVYMCEWAGCGRCFDSARLVYIHASKTHVPALPEAVCDWHGCEPLRRKRWSLVTHLQDHHCSEMAQRAGCQRRFQAAQTAAAAAASSSSPQPPTPLQQAPALVYPPDAAMQAIKRFHIKPPFAEFNDPREGPVTKHIRLTAALILRNLARYSALGRSLIKHRERQLSYVTISACESSTALSSCLWEILHDT
ncbi:hypothetical protein ACOMHN_016552 [Nucella lapillus]